MAELADRFWSKVDVSNPNECWVWTAAARDGYGAVKVSGKVEGAHRVSYLLAHGRWPEPHCLHSCDNSLCVNPQHLREGDYVDNAQDKSARGRNPWDMERAAIRECLNGR